MTLTLPPAVGLSRPPERAEFELDRVFCGLASQKEVADGLNCHVEDVLNGYNSAVVVHGGIFLGVGIMEGVGFEIISASSLLPRTEYRRGVTVAGSARAQIRGVVCRKNWNKNDSSPATSNRGGHSSVWGIGLYVWVCDGVPLAGFCRWDSPEILSPGEYLGAPTCSSRYDTLFCGECVFKNPYFQDAPSVGAPLKHDLPPHIVYPEQDFFRKKLMKNCDFFRKKQMIFFEKNRCRVLRLNTIVLEKIGLMLMLKRHQKITETCSKNSAIGKTTPLEKILQHKPDRHDPFLLYFPEHSEQAPLPPEKPLRPRES